MKRLIPITLALLLLCGCGVKQSAPETAAPVTVAPTTQPLPTEIVTEPVPTETAPLHSEFYIPGLDVEDVIAYFNEVCLDAEFSDSGDPSKLQKWDDPIFFIINGPYSEEDIQIIMDFTNWLNTLEGFPGMEETQDPSQANLQIFFRDNQGLVDLMGDNFISCDGGVTFWYVDDRIYDAIICYSTEISQTVRNSVILEEIYNGLGPVQDTDLRPDSIIYSGYAEPQELTEIDELILKLLYHPEIQCGMDAAQCEAVIRTLYY